MMTFDRYRRIQQGDRGSGMIWFGVLRDAMAMTRWMLRKPIVTFRSLIQNLPKPRSCFCLE